MADSVKLGHVSDQPVGFLLNMDNIDGIDVNYCSDQPEANLQKKESVESTLNDSSICNTSDKKEEIVPKLEILTGDDLPGTSCGSAQEQPKGVLQLIDRLETVVDQLLPRYDICKSIITRTGTVYQYFN